MQAKDIPDALLLAIVDVYEHVSLTRFGLDGGALELNEPGDMTWTLWSDVDAVLQGAFPHKVLLAKANALIRRGLLRGCGCGCRGDFGLTWKGRAFLSALTGDPPDEVVEATP